MTPNTDYRIDGFQDRGEGKVPYLQVTDLTTESTVYIDFEKALEDALAASRAKFQPREGAK